MNVVLVSQCNKNALRETRRILDQFAERIGERSWQTPITSAGLDTLRRMLRRTARKNTAVACHWIKGRDHSELMWIVGDASRFNARGAVPTDTTRRDVLRRGDENDWHTGEDILLLTGIAALFHDLGKACIAFQRRLLGKGATGANRYRHEWISLRLFQAMIGDDGDQEWLGRLEALSIDDAKNLFSGVERDGIDAESSTPLSGLPPVAAAVGWLILSHHRLPVRPQSDRGAGFRASDLDGLPGIITADWNQSAAPDPGDGPGAYWQFDHDLPVVTERWRRRARHLAARMRQRLPANPPDDWLAEPYVMHISRMALMLADHHYSSLVKPDARLTGQAGYFLYANTVRETGELNQPLDEHLLGVEADTRAICRSLPNLHTALPRLARHKGFRKRSRDKRFAWQDRAFDLAVALRDKTERHGFFGVNMASTGCGKTLANGRITYALADSERGARFSVALGLRTLTLQTGEAYRVLLGLGPDELAVRVGGSASSALFEFFADQAEDTGSASSQSLIEEDGHVYFEGDFTGHPILRRLEHDPGVRALLAAPVLVSTVDHLVPATEGIRGGRQIGPMLRLMSSDLILDEVDDFGLEDLPALTRLVHWSGLLGGRVLLSSATLPPSLVEGLYRAYRAGRSAYQRHRGEPGLSVDIPCAWFDEHGRRHADCPEAESFREAHRRFATRRQERLTRDPSRRRAKLVAVENPSGSSLEGIADDLARAVLDQAGDLHERHHTVDPRTGKRVSFGLIRMANIEPLVAVAEALIKRGAPSGKRLHLCIYHSQFPALSRSAIEDQLDRALDRRDEWAVFDQPDIRAAIDGSPEPEQLFVVLGSPVTEVGRDHDYDWAIVEPSSMRSVIQLAGRVGRHRNIDCDTPNIHLLRTNVRAMRSPGQPAFRYPGFEDEGRWLLKSHDLRELLRPEEYEVVDARPRVLPRESPMPNERLADLEHARLERALVPDTSAAGAPNSGPARRAARTHLPPPLNAATWYAAPRATLSGDLPRRQPFRRQIMEQAELVLMPDEAGEDWHPEKVWYERGRKQPTAYMNASKEVDRIDLSAGEGEGVSPWATTDYMTILATLADDRGESPEKSARIFGVVRVPAIEGDRGWRYHPWLGFMRWR